MFDLSPSPSPPPSQSSSRSSSVSFTFSDGQSLRTSSISSSSSSSSSTSLSSAASSIDTSTLHLPRIICLHGGGVSARIFRAQCRELIRRLPHFRLVFVDAPFLSSPGPNIVPTYGAWGPFRRWVRWKESDPELSDADAIKAIVGTVELCKARDAGTGDWVGILGFSQGAKMAASILYQQQWELEQTGRTDTDYKFGVLMAGRGPLVDLCPEHMASNQSPALVKAGALSVMEWRYGGVVPNKLTIPTIHVHGLQDQGLRWHRYLMSDYCAMNSGVTTLIEWDGDHRIPIKGKDVDKVVGEIYRVAREEGVDV